VLSRTRTEPRRHREASGMTETPPAPPARRRSRIRLSARGLTILVLVLGAGPGWVIRPARMQREAVTAIQRLGGNVTYDLSPEELPIGGQSRPRGKMRGRG
jgi:hypothetical protein